MWLSGGALALFVSVMTALLFAADFSSGYVKNLPTSRKDRLAYYGEKLVLVVLLVALLLVFGIATLRFPASSQGFPMRMWDRRPI